MKTPSIYFTPKNGPFIMQQITEQITKRLLGNLPGDADFIKPDELLNYGFPEFLVKRIQLELGSHLSTSLNLYKNEWVDTTNITVKTAWDDFLNEISPLAHLPLSYASNVVRKAVADVLLMLVEPRACLPDFIFFDDNKLTLDEVIRRCEQLTVYRHFGSALPRFMEKKNLDAMSKEQCSHFITALDEKLISRYTFSNWQKLFEPWFLMMGPELSPALLQHFFNDKDDKGTAQSFAKQQSPLSLNNVVQIIKRPDTSDIIQEEVAGPARSTIKQARSLRLKEEISEETIVGAVKDTQDFEEDSIIARAHRANLEEENDLASENLNEPADEKSIFSSNSFQQTDDKGQSDEEEAAPIWKQFTPYEPDDDEYEAEESEELEELEAQQPAGPDAPLFEEAENMKEVEENDVDNGSAIFEQFNEDHSEEKNFVEKNGGKDIIKYVGGNKEYYVDNLFGGDEDLFHDVLEDLQACNEWKEAVRFLTEDVFRRNFIDIYSEPAVDFTDLLQDYFKKEKS
ncbi:MAG: hypothetical protein WD038_07380 [Balneolales bacterium]